jgi:hypothetical protein
MKSAYELAMEKLERSSGPTRKLTDEQKTRIAENDTLFEARIAQVRLRYDADIQQAPSLEVLNDLKNAMSEELRELNEQRDSKRSEIWDEHES